MVSKSFCQTVDSIAIEQAGTLIKIRYKILNSNPYQTFRVTVSSSINGGLKSELRSLTGDFGENIIGGKSYYMVIWDVLSDIEEVTSFDITIKAELTKDQTPEFLIPILWPKERFYIILTMHEGRGVLLGLRFAYAENWGVSARYTAGYYEEDYPYEKAFASHLSISLSKRIVNYKATQLHISAGISYCTHLDHMGAEYGFIVGIRRFVISCFGERLFIPDPGPEENLNNYANFGFGMRF